ncbi:MAG: hypothetical protein ACREFF_05635 [Candidatus Udaeobacter sp.]
MPAKKGKKIKVQDLKPKKDAKGGIGQHTPVQHGPGQHGPVQHGPGQHGPVQHGPGGH